MTLARLVRERSTVGGQALEEGDVERFAATAALLPMPPASVLDVGCGTGALVDALQEAGYDASGIDTDAEAMRLMTAPHRVASIAAIPADDRSVDVVIANEVLEHLPVDVYPQALTEVARVAGRRVIVTVPNEEDLESASTRCPQCACTYSIHGHVRRFTRSAMADLLPGLRLTHLSTVGPYKVRHRSVEWIVRRRMLGRWPRQAGAVCPQCGFRQAGERRPASRQGLLRTIIGAPWQRWWMVVAYDR